MDTRLWETINYFWQKLISIPPPMIGYKWVYSSSLVSWSMSDTFALIFPIFLVLYLQDPIEKYWQLHTLNTQIVSGITEPKSEKYLFRHFLVTSSEYWNKLWRYYDISWDNIAQPASKTTQNLTIDAWISVTLDEETQHWLKFGVVSRYCEPSVLLQDPE